MTRHRPFGLRHFLIYGFILYGLVFQLHHWLWILIIGSYELFNHTMRKKIA